MVSTNFFKYKHQPYKKRMQDLVKNEEIKVFESLMKNCEFMVLLKVKLYYYYYHYY